MMHKTPISIENMELGQPSLWDQLQDGLLFLNGDFHVLFLNRVAKDLLQYSPATLAHPFTSDSRFNSAIQRISEVRKNPRGEILQFNGRLATTMVFAGAPECKEGFTALLCPCVSLEESTKKPGQNKGFVAKSTFDDIICNSPASQEAVNLSKQYALTNSNILVVGESGTGKEVFVQAIHNGSSRSNGPFVAINCAALPENLLESELFGYVGGAFTGATRQGRKGYFELAHKGTIFLDEIGEVSHKLQARLLRVIQEKEITRVGDERMIHVDTRIISATNKDLPHMVEQRLFREDLYYRIDVLRIQIPPIRDRPEDIPTLIEHLLLRASPQTEIHPDAVRRLTEYSWPGNIRQLNNLCERAVALSDKVLITPEIVSYLLAREDESQRKKTAISTPEEFSLEKALSTLPIPPSDVAFLRSSLQKRNDERVLYSNTMSSVHQNKTAAAKILGISRSTLWRKLKTLGLE